MHRLLLTQSDDETTASIATAFATAAAVNHPIFLTYLSSLQHSIHMNCGTIVNATSLRHSQSVLQLARACVARPHSLCSPPIQQQACGSRQQHVAVAAAAAPSLLRGGSSSRQVHVCSAVAAAAEPAATPAAVAQEVRFAHVCPILWPLLLLIWLEIALDLA